jgi:archaellum biogenesis ATPase FlaH
MKEQREKRIMAKLDIASFYKHQLDKFRSYDDGARAMALCPFHGDTKPSLSIDLKKGIWHCFGCEASGNIVSFYMKQYEVDYETALKELESIGETQPSASPRIVATYDYVNEDGKPLFQVVRFKPKEFRMRRPDRKGGWSWDLRDVRLVPYNLPQILEAKKALRIIFQGKILKILPSKQIFIAEGEKDADALRNKGLVATCNPMGAGKWREEFNEHFNGAKVVIIPDNDDAGRKHAETVAQNLKVITKSVKVVSLPNLPERGDITDWLYRGGTRNELISLIGKTPIWESRSLLSFLMKGSDLIAMNVEVTWLIERLIPQRSVTILHGRGGIGKTWLSLQLADAVSKGTNFMNLQTRKATVVYVDFENSLDVLHERVHEINASKVYFWHLSNKEIAPPKLDKENWTEYKNLPQGSLLIFDTLRASQNTDENSSKDMAFILNRLKELREKGFTIIMLHHTPKGREMTYKGSTAILDLADHVLSLNRVKRGKPDEEAEDDENETYFRFGTKEKTRYEPFHIFLEFKNKGFIAAPDPDEKEILRIRRYILRYKKTHQVLPNQTQVCEEYGREHGISKKEIRRLLNKGTKKYWTIETGPNNAKFYKAAVRFFIHIGRKKPKNGR